MKQPPDTLEILIPAAGASSRMRGRDKLLEQVKGRTLLRHVVDAAIDTGLPVYVALPPDTPARLQAVRKSSATVLAVPDAATGMSASFRAYARARPQQTHGTLIMLADMPDITTADLLKLIAAFTAQGCTKIIRASDANGTPGHPVIFPARLVTGFATLTGDQGARDILISEQAVLVALSDARALTDLDTPEDWAAWLALKE